MNKPCYPIDECNCEEDSKRYKRCRNFSKARKPLNSLNEKGGIQNG